MAAGILALWTASRYALAAPCLAGLQGPDHWRRLRELCADVAALRRGDHATRRLRLDYLRFAARRPVPASPTPPPPDILSAATAPGLLDQSNPLA